MQVITIHEAFPGHYIQFLYSKEYPTKTRKLTFCGTNAEGWAHYCEQMALEEGYGDGDPKIQLAQLSEALFRDCRYVVGIKLHTQGMTVEQGTDVFVKEGFQEPANAFEEARRGAYNPTYLYYTLGKLQIYKLREDYRKAKGSGLQARDLPQRIRPAGRHPDQNGPPHSDPRRHRSDAVGEAAGCPVGILTRTGSDQCLPLKFSGASSFQPIRQQMLRYQSSARDRIAGLARRPTRAAYRRRRRPLWATICPV